MKYVHYHAEVPLVIIFIRIIHIFSIANRIMLFN